MRVCEEESLGRRLGIRWGERVVAGWEGGEGNAYVYIYIYVSCVWSVELFLLGWGAGGRDYKGREREREGLGKVGRQVDT